MLIRFSPEFTEWFPAVMALLAALLLGGLALYTRHTARPRGKDWPAE